MVVDDGNTPLPSQTCKKRRYDVTDRQLHRTHFLKIQDMTRPFTLDACADPNGYNAQCANYCSLQNNFLAYDCSHHHVWINPPFQHKSMHVIIRHYLECKRKAPTTTSACILLPAWAILPFQRYLTGMKLLTTYPAGVPVMTVPTIPPTQDRLIFSTGLPFNMHVYYDPPLPDNYQPSKVSPSLQKLALLAPCYVCGTQATVQMATTIKGQMAIDTLASRNFIDSTFVRQLKVRIKKHPPWLNNAIILGDNTTKQTEGVVHVHIQIDKYQDTIWCDVLKLPDTFQLILGQEWLNKHQCILNFPLKTCTLMHRNRKYTLDCSQHQDIPYSPRHDNLEYTFSNPLFLSALQTKRLLRKTKSIDHNHSFLILVQHTASPLQASNPIDPALQAILDKHRDVFSEPPIGLPPPRNINHSINLVSNANPPFRAMYRLSLTERQEVTSTIEDLLTKQYIQPSTSPFGAPILFVGKKDGTLRMCVDYRALNKLTIKNRYPLPRIDDLLDQLSGAKYFTTLDLASGYHQIRINPKDIHKTAFRTNLGHYEWKVMPFGLCNAPATFQNAMNNLFGSRIGKYVLVYMDDILVYSKTKEEHLHHLNEVLSLLATHKYYIKHTKCDFMKTQLKFLGHVICANGLRVDPDKIEVIKTWSPPKDKPGIRSLLGFGNYFRRFIYKYSEMVAPLLHLTKNNTPTVWTPECQIAFDNLKDAIINAPVLQHPDLNKPFQVICDASNYATGTILMQDDHPCAFASKKLLPAECNYTTEEKELLAVIHALKLFRCYLEGNTFTICTDHNPLKYFDTKQDLSPRQARWAQYLSRFNYTWEWIKGKTNPADFLSRNPTLATLCMAITRSQTHTPPVPSHDPTPLRKPSKRTHQYSANHMPLHPPVTSSETQQLNLTDKHISHSLITLGY